MRSRAAAAAMLAGAINLLAGAYHQSAFPIENGVKGQEQQAVQPQLTYDISVTVKNIEVIVRDKDGRWMTGLKPENFRVYEDGVLRKITHFHEASGQPPAAGREERPDAPGVEEATAAAVPEAIQNRIVFFFDNPHLHPVNRNWISKKLVPFIAENFKPGTTNQAMVVFLDQNLEIVQDFTSDSASLIRAVAGVRDRTSDALTRAKSWDNVQQEITLMISRATRQDDIENYQLAASLAHGYIEEEANRLAFSLNSLQALVGRLEGLKGRKMLVYASDRLPLNPAEEVFRFISRLFPSLSAETEAMTYDATEVFRQTIASCNAQDISVYALLAEDFALSASTADKTNWGVKVGGLRPINPGAARYNDGMEGLSRETGGSVVTAKRDSNSGLETLSNDLSQYYSLGYTSDAPADGSIHTIDVKVVGAGADCALRFRTGYLRNSPEETVKNRVIARLFLPQRDNPLDARVQVLPVEKQPFGQLKMRLKILVPISRLSLRPVQSEHVGAIKVYVAMMDSARSWSEPDELQQDIRIPDQDLEKARAMSYPYLVELYVKPGSYFFSLAVTDDVGRMTSYFQFARDVR